MEFANINEFTHSTIGFSSIKFYDSRETNRFDYKFSKFTNGEFLTCADIDMAVTNLTKI